MVLHVLLMLLILDGSSYFLSFFSSFLCSFQFFCFIANGDIRVAEVGSVSALAKTGYTNFRQVRNCYSRDKCVVFARNCKFAHLTQDTYHVIVHFLPKNTVFDPKKHFFA